MDKKIKVLMVDDEAQFRATTSRILAKKGFETTMAADGEEAIRLLKESPQDVVVLDIKMPGMDGHEALEKIKKLAPDTQVIMLTGHGGLESAKESLKQGAYDYLTKPCDIDLLATKINSAFESIHGKRDREEKKAGDIMIHVEEYTRVDMDATVKEAIIKLKASFECLASTNRVMETGHRSILVFDHRGELAGILSIVDLLEGIRPAYLSAPKPSMADSMQYSTMFWTGLFTQRTLALGKRKVREIMSESPPMVQDDANLMEVAELMFREKARRIAVMQQKKIVGILREQELFFEISNILQSTT
jgi:DNA-binding response OmpR family regulator